MSILRRHLILATLGAATLFVAGYGAGAYRGTITAERRRVAGRTRTADTRFGPIEFVVAGEGSPLLMLHGTGGGFDQALLIASGFVARGFRVIAPSRPGYLGSAIRDGVGPAGEADAMADLLDHLGLGRVAVAGASAGAIPAMQVALRYPERCSHLVLLAPAANLTGEDPVDFSPAQERLVRTLLGSDFWFWAALTLAPNRLLRLLLATDPALLDRVSPAERARAQLMLHSIMPVRGRATGMLLDARAAGAPAMLDPSEIKVPTLVVSAEDDLFGTARTARILEREVPGAQLLIFDDGGHIFLGRQDEMSEAVAAFVRQVEG